MRKSKTQAGYKRCQSRQSLMASRCVPREKAEEFAPRVGYVLEGKPSESKEATHVVSELKIGMIGLDTSHCPAFTNLLNNPDNPHHVPGGKVLWAYPGGSKQLAQSYDRVEGFTNQLRDEFGVEILDSIEAVAERSDAILLESVDGRCHLEEYRKIAPYGKPVFIDKPLTTSSKEAEEIFALSEEHGSPVFSSSSLRYAAGIVETFTDKSVLGCEAHGPNAIIDNFPGVFWYGIHSGDILFAAMGAGCREVRVESTPMVDVIVGTWEDDRVGLVYGYRFPKVSSFGATVFTTEGIFQGSGAKAPPPYASLLEQVIPFFQTGRSPVAKEETLQVIRFLEAANESKESGKAVAL